MSVLLFVAGAVAFVSGAVMVGFGIPVHEFSFGNTLILAGVFAMVGGLIVVGLGLVVSHLQQLTDALTRGAPLRAGRPLTPMDAAGRLPAAPARIPFPSRPKAEQKSDLPSRDPVGFDQPAEPPSFISSEQSAPTLPNPDEAPVTVEDEVSLSPRHPFAPVPPVDLDEPLPPPPFLPRVDQADHDRPSDQPSAFEATWRTSPKETQSKPAMPKASAPKVTPPMAAAPTTASPKAVTPSLPRQNTYFDSMWPTEAKESKAETPADRPIEAKTESMAEPKFQSPFAPPEPAKPKSEPQLPTNDEAPQQAFAWQDEEPAQAEEPRAVAILKSGVVDGMGYTLYVDGSIEAELPQGTLHFASINELRSHLEKTS